MTNPTSVPITSNLYPPANSHISAAWSVGGITNGTDAIWYLIRKVFVPNVQHGDILTVEFAEEYRDDNASQWTVECVDCAMLDAANADGSAPFTTDSTWLSGVAGGTYNKATGLPTLGFNLAHPIGRNSEWATPGHYNVASYTVLWLAPQAYPNGVWISHWARFRSSSASPPYGQNQTIENNGWLQVKQN